MRLLPSVKYYVETILSHTLTSHLLPQVTSNPEKQRESPPAAERRSVRLGDMSGPMWGLVEHSLGSGDAVVRARQSHSADLWQRLPVPCLRPRAWEQERARPRAWEQEKAVSESLWMSGMVMLLPQLNLSLWGHLLGCGRWVTYPSHTPKTSPELHASMPVTPQPARLVQEGPFPGASFPPTASPPQGSLPRPHRRLPGNHAGNHGPPTGHC